MFNLQDFQQRTERKITSVNKGSQMYNKNNTLWNNYLYMPKIKVNKISLTLITFTFTKNLENRENYVKYKKIFKAVAN